MQARLNEVLEIVIHLDRQETFCGTYNRSPSSYSLSMTNEHYSRCISSDSLVIGAIETAFLDMVPLICKIIC